MKSKKLNIDELKVKSFVTNFTKEKANTAKGGLNTLGNCHGRTDDGDCWGAY